MDKRIWTGLKDSILHFFALLFQAFYKLTFFITLNKTKSLKFILFVISDANRFEHVLIESILFFSKKIKCFINFIAKCVLLRTLIWDTIPKYLTCHQTQFYMKIFLESFQLLQKVLFYYLGNWFSKIS